MLNLRITLSEEFDEEKNEFITTVCDLELEHSLVSVSKWEQFFKKPFLSEEPHTPEEMLAYIHCMVLSPDVPAEVLDKLSQKQLEAINDYINDAATATWFNERSKSKPTSEVLTSELIYYWMFAQGIPKECENWHINRLITLLKIFNFKNEPEKKMSPEEARAHQRRLNAQRRAQFENEG